MPNLIKGLRYIKGNNLGFAMKFKGPIPVVPNKGEKIRGGSLLTKSVLPVVDKFVFFKYFIIWELIHFSITLQTTDKSNGPVIRGEGFRAFFRNRLYTSNLPAFRKNALVVGKLKKTS